MADAKSLYEGRFDAPFDGPNDSVWSNNFIRIQSLKSTKIVFTNSEYKYCQEFLLYALCAGEGWTGMTLSSRTGNTSRKIVASEVHVTSVKSKRNCDHNSAGFMHKSLRRRFLKTRRVRSASRLATQTDNGREANFRLMLRESARVVRLMAMFSLNVTKQRQERISGVKRSPPGGRGCTLRRTNRRGVWQGKGSWKHWNVFQYSCAHTTSSLQARS